MTFAKVKTSKGIVELPIYHFWDFPSSPLRVMTKKGWGTYDLIPPTSKTRIRVMTSKGIMGVNTIATNYSGRVLNLESNIYVDTGVTMLNNSDHFEISCIGWGTDVGFKNAKPVKPRTNYVWRVLIEIIENPSGGTITTYVSNDTQQSPIKMHVMTSTNTVGVKQQLTGTFNTSDEVSLSDVVTFMIQANPNPSSTMKYIIHKSELFVDEI